VQLQHGSSLHSHPYHGGGKREERIKRRGCGQEKGRSEERKPHKVSTDSEYNIENSCADNGQLEDPESRG